jgi:hypothetical protein
MENKIVLQLNNGTELVAELYNYDGNHPEISIYIQEGGIASQDICLVRPSEDANKYSETVECLVWGDECSEDYTDKFVIAKY